MVPRRQLANANALGLVSTYGTLPLGGGIFALLAAFSTGLAARVPWLGGRPQSLALLLDGGTFLFSAFMVSRITFPPKTGGLRGRFDLTRIWRDVVDGLKFLREDSIASAMTAGIVVAFGAVGAVLALGPIFVRSLDAGDAAWGVIVTAFGVGMALGMAATNQVAKFVDRGFTFVWALVAAAGALFVLATMPNLPLASVVTVWLGAFCGLAWVSGYTLLQENVEDEYRGRTFASLTTLSRMGLFLSLTVFPILSSVYGDYEFYVGGQRFDLSGTRLALWTAGLLAAIAGLNTRRLLHRHRLSRPQPLALVPKLKRPPATGLFIAFEGVEGAGKGTQIAMAEEYLRAQASQDVLVTREPGGTELGEKIREVLLDPKTRQARRAQRGAAVRRGPRPDRDERDPSGARRGQGRHLRSLRRLVARLPGLGARSRRGRRAHAERLGDAGPVPRPRHPAAPRARARSLAFDRGPRPHGARGQDFHAKVSDAYLRIAEEHPERFVVIDADKEPAEVFDDVRAALDKALEEYEAANGEDPR